MMTHSVFLQLFSSILDSSLRREDAETRWVFVTMLILGDEHGDGVVDMPVEALASRAALSEEATVRALARLGLPDPDSASQEEEGRRIIPLHAERPERGWVIVNWPKYKALANAELRREQLRNASAAYRKRLKEMQQLKRRGRRHQTSSVVISRQRRSAKVSPTKAYTEAESYTEAALNKGSGSVQETAGAPETKISLLPSEEARPADAGPPTSEKRTARQLAEVWNAESGVMPKVTIPLTKERTAKARSRLAVERDLDRWRAAVRRLAVGGCAGESWATFDFLIRNDTNLVKIEEGRYDEAFGGKHATPGRPKNLIVASEDRRAAYANRPSRLVDSDGGVLCRSHTGPENVRCGETCGVKEGA